MHRSYKLAGFLLRSIRSVSSKHSLRPSDTHRARNDPVFSLQVLLPLAPKRRGFCGYAAEQFSDDEYECDFEGHKASSTVANINEWKWKLGMLLRSETDQEVTSWDKRDRRDYEQISFLAKRMVLYSQVYGKAVVVSKFPLPNYRPDLDDRRPQREVVIPLSLQRRVEGLLQEHLDRTQLSSGKISEKSEESKPIDLAENVNMKENRDSFLDGSVMEKVLQRRSLQMRNMQRAWQYSDASKWVSSASHSSQFVELPSVL